MPTTDELNTRLTALEMRVTALDGGGTPVPLPAPTGVTATVNPNKTVSVQWNPVTGAASYDVLENGVKTGSVPSSPGVTPVKAPGNYAYSVRAVAADGTIGAVSPAASVTIPAETGTVTVTGTRTDDLHVRVDWTTTRTDVTGWIVSRDGIDSGGSGPWTSGTLAAGTRSFVFGNLLKTTAYNLRITAKTPGGDVVGTFTTVIDTTGGGGGGNPPVDDPTDGVQAAQVFNWGAVQGGDEFNDASFAKWGRYNGAGHNGNGRRVPSAFTIESGVLVCTGLQNGDAGGMAYTAGGVGSAKLYRDEARMRVFATGAGSGSQYHPVLIRWPDSDSWPQGGEDDYVEFNVGDSGVQWFIHRPNQGDGGNQASGSKALDPTQWHNYAIERSSAGVKIFIDGQQLANYSMSSLNGQVPGPMHPTIQLDNFGGSSHKVARMEVKYYRIYSPPA